MRKKDVLVIFFVLLLAGGGLLLSQKALEGNASGKVNVYVDGKLYATGYVGQQTPIVVKGENGEENTIVLTEKGFYMGHSTCKNQLCVEQGPVTLDNYKTRAMGTRIICLPNRVVVELMLDQTAADDSLPDV